MPANGELRYRIHLAPTDMLLAACLRSESIATSGILITAIETESRASIGEAKKH